MNAKRWQEVRALFEVVCELSPSERRELLTRTCAEDADLAAEVESLLESEHDVPAMLKRSAVESLPEVLGGDGGLGVGKQVGKYVLVKEIGGGGMGSVYLAESNGDQVAIKFVRGPIITPDAVRRFRIERESLERLDHPGIARFLDGGVTATGVPFLVMEYVCGTRLDTHCDEQRLSPRQRISLFLDVCAAVTYAHQERIIHRDLKPSNVMVHRNGRTKLLDFGIAKILQSPDNTRTTETTATLHRVMTPEYASPEQLRGEAVDTASDVYSLGVLLYELLTGRHPCPDRRVQSPYVSGETDPKRPSAAVAGDTTASELRGLSPTELRRQLAGDLDGILLKALSFDPADRYDTVDAFHDDLRRFLGGEPVQARRPTWTVNARRFVKRNRVSVAAGVAASLFLFAGMVSSSWHSRAAAEAQQAAMDQKQKAERVRTFLQGMLSPHYVSPIAQDSQALRAILDEASARIGAGELDGQPEVEVMVRMSLGSRYQDIACYTEAETQLNHALEILVTMNRPNDAALPECLESLGMLYRLQDRAPEAEDALRESLALRQLMSGDQHPDLAPGLRQLALVLWSQNKAEEAEGLLHKGTRILRQALRSAEIEGEQDIGDTAALFAYSVTSLAEVLARRGAVIEAETICREALTYADVITPSEISIAPLAALGRVMLESNDPESAEPILEEAVSQYRQKGMAEADPRLADAVATLACCRNLLETDSIP